MKKTILFRVVVVLVAMIALGWLPQSTLAQRGGHGGGGGGFHGGGGGGFHGRGGAAFHGGGSFSGGAHSAYVGGRSYAGYRGGYYAGHGYYGGRGYYGGYHGGYGWGGGYWGRGYGYGWGWGVGFGWPYWGWGWGYPYGYYYSPGYYGTYPYYSYPYYGPSDDPTGNPDPNNGDDNPPPADPNARPQPNQSGPARAWRPPVPGGAPNPSYTNGDASSRGPVLSTDRMSATPSGYQAAGAIPAHFTTAKATTGQAKIAKATAQADAPLRPEMQKALQRLSEMPPFAREREIETGRYSKFSSEEKQILRNGQ